LTKRLNQIIKPKGLINYLKMTEQEKSTEEIIFDAAQKVFVLKGFDGARMQEIAQEAKINKALLHYYYRTKEKLFHAIFERVLSYIIPRVLAFVESDEPIFSKIEFFVNTYVELLLKNPYIPNFVISELNRNPDSIAEMLGGLMVKNDALKKFTVLINKEIEKGTIRPIRPEHLFVNMISLCIFPFVARPIIQGVIFKNDKERYQEFLMERKKEVASFIINSIKIEK
jgi:TetR/AcrR family transcriptional regulator